MDAEREQVVWINARFIDRPVTGVERVAHSLLGALHALLDMTGALTLPSGQRVRFRLIAPAGHAARSPWAKLPLVRGGPGQGHTWEQLTLPLLIGGDWLLSLCNTGPLLKRRHLIYLHDAQPWVVPDNFRTSIRLWYRVLFRVAGRRAAAVLTNSACSRDELARHAGLPPNRIQMVSPGADHLQSLAVDDEIVRANRLDQGPYLLAVASNNRNKNFPAIIAALEHLQRRGVPVRAAIAGASHDRVFATALDDNPMVVRLGRVTDAQLLGLYRHALCLVMPSFHEGFGLPAVEAMTNGCVVVASRRAALPEVCGEAALYCDPEAPQTIAEAVGQLLQSPGLHGRLRDAGLRRAAEFTWSTGAAQLIHALDRAICGGPRTWDQ